MTARRAAVICWTLFAIAPLGSSGADVPAAQAPPPAPPPADPAQPTPTAAPDPAAPAAQDPAAPPDPAAPAAPAAPSDPGGTVAGKIIDPASALGFPGATIRVLGAGGGQSVASDLEGGFTLTLPPGTYTIAVSAPEFVEQQREITVGEAQSVAVELTLVPVPRVGKEEVVEVFSSIDPSREAAQLADRRLAATVSDGITSQQIARSPDSNASDAAKRVVSATIQDNRYIVIRGLGGRYSTTLLNGVPLPSPDPDVPAAPLDLFPAALLTHLNVNKTFAPDMPGNFAGGVLGIETRRYPTRFVLKARASLSGNTESSFRQINGQRGGGLDFFGFDNGTRSLPSAISDTQLAGGTGLSTAQRNTQISGFKNTWAVQRDTAKPNVGFGLTLGDTTKLADRRLGYFGSVSFGHSYTRRLAHLTRVGEPDGEGGRIASPLQLDERQGIESASLGAVAGAGWSPRPGHQIDVFALYAHTADISASEVTGTDLNNAVIERTRLQFLQRELLFNQVVGENQLGDKLILDWQGNVARVAQHDPDTRDLLRIQNGSGEMVISTGSTSGERVFSELADTTLGAAVAVRAPYDTVKLKAGAAIQRSARDYQTRRFDFDLTADMLTRSPSEAFDPGNAGTAMSMSETTQPIDGYAASRLIAAGYAMADVNVTPELRLIGGARLERSDLEVGLASRLALGAPSAPPTARADTDVLPSLNAIYALTRSTNLRAAYSMTLARANFREIAPTIYFDYVRRRVLSGNPDLEETHIQNADLRWETFPGEHEVIAASVFGKYFARPIERTIMLAGSGDNISFQNEDSAYSYGLELEARLSLARLTPALGEFSISGNLSLIGSRIDVGSGVTRPLQGQSPYVANLGLGYESKAVGTRVDLAYNSFGRRIEEVGTGGLGNVHEEPVHRLDLTVSQPLPRKLRVKLAATNLLDERVVRTQDDVEIHAYPVGVTVLGSVEYSLE
jgi:TonB dependent receptor/Carboxypeptidase regulatory-like domain/TonB-dependent Receptor Plug Domain